MPEINDNELASSLQISISSLVKALKREVKHDEDLAVSTNQL